MPRASGGLGRAGLDGPPLPRHPSFLLGWGRNAVGMVLDDDTDWDEVTEIVTESYCVLAPEKLVALVDRPPVA